MVLQETSDRPAVMLGTSSDRIGTSDGQAYFLTVAKDIERWVGLPVAPYAGVSYVFRLGRFRPKGVLAFAFGLVPDIAFVIIDAVFFEQVAVFVLKGLCMVVFFLAVDIMKECLLLVHAHGKCPVAVLPMKGRECRVLSLQPFAGGGFN